MTSIDIGVTTVCRPSLLQSALNSLIGMSLHPDWIVRIIVVDNDVNGSARETVNKFAATSPAPIIYLHQPRRGVSHARNAVLRASTADYLAFFDDDQIADKAWLESLVATAGAYSADVVSAGLSVLPQGIPHWIAPVAAFSTGFAGKPARCGQPADWQRLDPKERSRFRWPRL